MPDAVCLSDELFSDASKANWPGELKRVLQQSFFDQDLRYIAVRSSSKEEDSAHESHAGRFRTEIAVFQSPDAVVDAARRVSRSGSETGCIPVVIQHAISARHSGVAFSCNPLTFKRDELVISIIEGMGSDLVSGKAQGRTLMLDRQGQIWKDVGTAVDKNLSIKSENLGAISKGLVLLEGNYKCPVDAEWAISEDGRLFWVQVRPVVLPRPVDVPLDTSEAFGSLPAVVRDHHKVRLRQWAIQSGIAMPTAVAHVRSLNVLPKRGPTSVGKDSAGTSVVLLYPTLIDGQVQREFSGTNGSYTDMIIESCQRYSIRRYPKFLDVYLALDEVLDRGFSHFWTSIAIDARILDAQLTGTISRIDGGYIVEIAEGHFVPKGVVVTQQFVIDEKLNLVHRRRSRQDFALRFVDGRVVHESPIADPVTVSDLHALAACRVLRPALDAGKYQAFEFGIRDAADVSSLYLIDTVEANGPTALTSRAIEAGVISPGYAEGRVCAIDGINDNDALDRHLHSNADSNGLVSNTIFLVDRDSIDLLPLVSSLGRNCGMLFRFASVLSHLAIVLREKGIPAITVGRESQLSTGYTILDTAEVERLYAAAREEP